MMTNPGQYLEAFRDAGAHSCSVHIEIGDTAALFARMRDLGLGVGLAINPETPFEAVEPWLGHIDVLLVMTVHPGFGGQSFMSEVVPKIAAAKAAIDAGGHHAVIEVDGGIDPETVGIVARAGAEVFVAGSAIFGHDDPVAAAAALRRAAEVALGATA
jgi:ribulose-phosphate 3-epimerase